MSHVMFWTRKSGTGNCNDDKYGDSETSDTEVEDESSLYETDSEESDSDEDMTEDARPDGIENYITPKDLLPPFTAFQCPGKIVSITCYSEPTL